jgi:hypothetical protein
VEELESLSLASLSPPFYFQWALEADKALTDFGITGSLKDPQPLYPELTSRDEETGFEIEQRN